jgi:ABC-type nickel/cobalt efflux system permease component RcnA
MISAVQTELTLLWLRLAAIQRDILAEVAATLRAFASSGDWQLLASFAPWAILFGAAHALTPGHSKTVLALWTAGTGARHRDALGTAVTLAAIHIGMSVAIVLVALPVVTMARGETGRAPLLEDLSRVLLGLVGLWLIWQAIRGHAHHPQGRWFAVAAGLVPCPLTLFVMTFAAAHGVTPAGIAFAAMAMIGVSLVLGTVALSASILGKGLRNWSQQASFMARALLAVSGAALALFAVAS